MSVTCQSGADHSFPTVRRVPRFMSSAQQTSVVGQVGILELVLKEGPVKIMEESFNNI